MTKLQIAKWETIIDYEDNGNFAYIKSQPFSNFSTAYYYLFINNEDYSIQFELRDAKHKKPDDNSYTVYFSGLKKDTYKRHKIAKRFSTLEEAMEYVKEVN